MKSTFLLAVAFLIGAPSVYGGGTWERWEPAPRAGVTLPKGVEHGGVFYDNAWALYYQYRRAGETHCLMRVEEEPRRVVFETPLRGMEACQEIE